MSIDLDVKLRGPLRLQDLRDRVPAELAELLHLQAATLPPVVVAPPFGDNGLAMANFGDWTLDIAGGLAFQSDGRIVVAGAVEDDDAFWSHFCAARFCIDPPSGRLPDPAGNKIGAA